jgi:hypothetical protein
VPDLEDSRRKRIAQAGRKNEIQRNIEACWQGYVQQGMKPKSGRMVPNCVKKEDIDICVNCGDLVFNESLDENLKKWFKQKWVRFGPDGKIRGDCARGSSKEGKPKCCQEARPTHWEKRAEPQQQAGSADKILTPIVKVLPKTSKPSKF